MSASQNSSLDVALVPLKPEPDASQTKGPSMALEKRLLKAFSMDADPLEFPLLKRPPRYAVKLFRKSLSALLYGAVSYFVVEVIWHLGELLDGDVLLSILSWKGGWSEHLPATTAFWCMAVGRFVKTHRMTVIHERGPEVFTFDVVKERAEDYLSGATIKGKPDPGLSWGRFCLLAQQAAERPCSWIS
jgi:hypothetical protein